jgi:hypothetical protein
VEATEIAEQIREHGEEPHHAATPDRLRRVAAVYVGFVAMLLAIATLGGANATKEMLNANIHASDTYAFYQAKYNRQLDYQIAAEELDLLGRGLTSLPPADSGKLADLIKRYRETASRYESDPAKGDGKKELLEKAHHWEELRDHATAQNPNFEYAEALYQIAIVLGSVAIVAASPWLLGLSGLLAVIGTLLNANGYLLLVPLGSG